MEELCSIFATKKYEESSENLHCVLRLTSSHSFAMSVLAALDAISAAVLVVGGGWQLLVMASSHFVLPSGDEHVPASATSEIRDWNAGPPNPACPPIASSLPSSLIVVVAKAVVVCFYHSFIILASVGHRASSSICRVLIPVMLCLRECSFPSRLPAATRKQPTKSPELSSAKRWNYYARPRHLIMTLSLLLPLMITPGVTAAGDGGTSLGQADVIGDEDAPNSATAGFISAIYNHIEDAKADIDTADGSDSDSTKVNNVFYLNPFHTSCTHNMFHHTPHPLSCMRTNMSMYVCPGEIISRSHSSFPISHNFVHVRVGWSSHQA